MAAPTRCIFLTGAPEADSLSWDEVHLISDFRAPLKRFLDERLTIAIEKATPTPTPTAPFAQWRSIEYVGLDLRRLPMADPEVEATQFLSFNNENADEALDDDHLGFLEHSVAVLDDVDSSQIVSRIPECNVDAPVEPQTSFCSTASVTTTSFTSTSLPTSNESFLDASPTKDGKKLSQLNIPGPVTDLKRIPNAEYITRIQPQTMTANLLVGIITVSPARTVRLKRRDAEMDIIELTIGDETRAGFSISFWLIPIESQRKPTDDLREALKHLRSGDVVVVQNVALSCFRGCIYGQSLSRKFARNSTSIAVLDGGSARGGSASVVAKLSRVRQWTSDFVGVARRQVSPIRKGPDRRRRKGDDLPPDTQDE